MRADLQNARVRPSGPRLRHLLLATLIVAAASWQAVFAGVRAAQTFGAGDAPAAEDPALRREVEAAAAVLRAHCAAGDDVLLFAVADPAVGSLAERLRNLAYPVRVVDGWTHRERPGDPRALWALVFPGALPAEQAAKQSPPVASVGSADLYQLREATPSR